MPEYMLLLYHEEVDEAEQAQRWAELPLWDRVIDQLREAGVWITNGALYGGESATTVRVRDDEVEMTDGPFAMTKEVLAGYFLIDCDDLDEALKVASMIPLVRYGSVEVRPLRPRRHAPADEPSSSDDAV